MAEVSEYLSKIQTPTGAVLTSAPAYTFRVPKPKQVDPFFGGARTFWLQRTLATKGNNYKPEVKSIVVRKRGSQRGIRFILFESALDYFQKLRAEQIGGDTAVINTPKPSSGPNPDTEVKPCFSSGNAPVPASAGTSPSDSLQINTTLTAGSASVGGTQTADAHRNVGHVFLAVRKQLRQFAVEHPESVEQLRSILKTAPSWVEDFTPQWTSATIQGDHDRPETQAQTEKKVETAAGQPS